MAAAVQVCSHTCFRISSVLLLSSAAKVLFLLFALCPQAAADIGRHLRANEQVQNYTGWLVTSAQAVARELLGLHLWDDRQCSARRSVAAVLGLFGI